MTTSPAVPTARRLLPLLPIGNRHGSRSYQTCLYRCGNACDQPEPNRSGNGHVRDEIAQVIGRRAVLGGAAAGSAALVLGGPGLSRAAAAPAAAGVEPPSAAVAGDLAKAAFGPVPPNKRDALVTPNGFRHSVVISWGDRVLADAPRFDVRNQTAEAAQKQFGYNCDYIGVLPLRRGEALLVVNHEYTNENLMFPDDTYTDAEIKAIAMASHGMSVVKVKKGRVPGSYLQVKPKNATRENRRIHAGTPFRVDGPAAGHELLRTAADPSGRTVLGTLNNCAGGTTPWGTVLSGEENFNQYFDAGEGLDERYTEQYARYGITGTDTRGWSEVDERFDLSVEPHEPHRFGWIVEVDPYDKSSTPVKHTMLGRFKHEGANIAIAKNGKAVAYMGDDERGEYLYKFVSAEKYDARSTPGARRKNMRLLSKGTLFVAQLTGDGADDGVSDGTGRWLPLCSDTESFVEGMSVAEVLVFTRLAADTKTATRMDRPEDVEPNLVTDRVYAALTNNSQRGTTFATDEANPLGSSQVRTAPGAPLSTASGNRNGYVLEMIPTDRHHAKKTFTWNLLLVCGDPEAPETYFGGYDKSKVSPISCPDNVAFDTAGNLWVSTDGNALSSNDGIFRVPTRGAERGHVEQFLTVPRGAEACGPLLTDGNRSLWVAVQHPGEADGATFTTPASTWPHTEDYPRPSVAVAYKAQ